MATSLMSSKLATTIKRNALIPAILGALCIAVGAIFVRLSKAEPATVSFFRCFYALPILAALALREHRQSGGRPLRAQMPIYLAGVLFGTDLVLWCYSINFVGAGLATVLSNYQVVIVPLAAWALFSERPSRRVVVAIPIALAGVVFISGVIGSGAYGSNPFKGAIFGVTSGIAYAGSLLAMRMGGKEELGRTSTRLFEMTMASALTAGIVGTALGKIDFLPGLRSQLWLIALALGSQVIGWFFITWALTRLPTATTALVLTLQPAGAVLLAMLILGESPSPTQLIGVGAVIAAIVIATTRLGKRRAIEPGVGIDYDLT